MPCPAPGARTVLRLWRWLPALLVLALGSGCATFRSYDKELTTTLSEASGGALDAAIRDLDKNNKGKDHDLLYYLEMGELKRLKTDYPGSQSAWFAAEQRVLDWEAAATADPARVAGAALSYVVNDKLRPYEGHDYEKVMLTTRMAMNHLAMGEWDNARVAIKRTHEREAVIAAVRSHEYEQLRAEARKRGYTPSFKDLNGYPITEIDNPEVNSLRNSYQSAISHYLAGFIYEAEGEPSLAAPGYRQAIELRPGVPLLEEALAGLDQRMATHDNSTTDTLFLIETGLAPAIQSRQFSLPIPINGELVLVSVSFPTMRAQGGMGAPGNLTVDGGAPLAPVQVTSIDAMARRALQDEMPGIMLRAAIRSTAKAAAQYQAQRAARQKHYKGDDGAAAALELAAIALAIGSAVTESADERSWRSLPAQMYIVRCRLPRGRHMVTIDTPDGPRSLEVNISGTHTFVGLRFLRGRLFAMLPPAGAGGAGAGQPASAPAPVGTVPAVHEEPAAPAGAGARRTDSPAN
jgi:hypothetical protein